MTDTPKTPEQIAEFVRQEREAIKRFRNSMAPVSTTYAVCTIPSQQAEWYAQQHETALQIIESQLKTPTWDHEDCVMERDRKIALQEEGLELLRATLRLRDKALCAYEDQIEAQAQELAAWQERHAGEIVRLLEERDAAFNEGVDAAAKEACPACRRGDLSAHVDGQGLRHYITEGDGTRRYRGMCAAVNIRALKRPTAKDSKFRDLYT